MEGFISIKGSAAKFGVSELCIWGLIRKKIIASSVNAISKLVVVSLPQLTKFMDSHPKELEVWQGTKQWRFVSEENGETIYTDGINTFSDKDLEAHSLEMERKNGYYE